MPTDAPFVTRYGASEYNSAQQLHTYNDVSGLRVLARCKSGASPKVVRVHQDYGTRTVTWSTSRSGRPPVIPKQGDIGFTLSAGGDMTVTDKYLGGSVDLPMPQRNDKEGAYNWQVNGTYTYLQVTNRKPGEVPLPTGGHPYPLIPQDILAVKVLQESGIGVVAPTGDNPIASVMTTVGDAIVKHETAFPWPFTCLPVQCCTTELIGC